MKLMKSLLVLGIMMGVYLMATKDKLNPISLEKLSEEVNMDLTMGYLVSTKKDTGFEDGIVLYEIDLSALKMNDLLTKNEWKEYPKEGLKDIVNQSIGIPSIEKGYYRIIDNQNAKVKVLMYDLQEEKLYYYKWY